MCGRGSKLGETTTFAFIHSRKTQFQISSTRILAGCMLMPSETAREPTTVNRRSLLKMTSRRGWQCSRRRRLARQAGLREYLSPLALVEDAVNFGRNPSYSEEGVRPNTLTDLPLSHALPPSPIWRRLCSPSCCAPPAKVHTWFSKGKKLCARTLRIRTFVFSTQFLFLLVLSSISLSISSFIRRSLLHPTIFWTSRGYRCQPLFPLVCV